MNNPIQHETGQNSGNPFVFVVGCPRSGTTLLRRILNAHSLIAIPKVETHWIPKFYKKGDGLTDDGMVTRAFIDILLAYHRFPRMGIGRRELEEMLGERSDLSFAEFVAQIFDFYGSTHGKALVGDKTPGYVRFIELLHSLFPAAKFIHLVRDGRDVGLSMLAWNRLHKTAGRITSFDDDPVTTTALYWEWLVRLGLESGEALPDGYYHQVSYESLVNTTEQASREMCEFLKVPFDKAMLQYHAGRESRDVALSAKKAWLPPTTGLRDWRVQMSADEILRFEAASGDLLNMLGYERLVKDIPPEALEHAADLRSRFDRKPHPVAWIA